MDATDLTVCQAREAIESGQLSAQGLVRACADRIDALNPTLNAFTQVFSDQAIDQAQLVDQRRAAGDDSLGSLAGIPIALKENICTQQGRTTCASRFLEEYRSPFTATAAQRLLDAGAIIIGKTNMDEFAMGSSTEHSVFGPTRNPWDTTRVPGGSSGGSAAAVAARLVPVALGSDTGGSIRQPAALCGVVGVKPTYGRVSRYGLVAFASSLDQIGPLTRSVDDAAMLLDVLCAHDPRDSTSTRITSDPLCSTIDAPIDDLRIAVPRATLGDRNDPGVNEAIQRSIEAFTSRGATIVDIELPHLDDAISAYYIIAPAEASSNLARYDGIRFGRRAKIAPDDDLATLYARSRAEGFGPEVQRRIMLGTYVLSAGYYDAYYLTAQKVRQLIRRDFDAVFDASPGCHAILMPTTPTPAFEIGQLLSDPLAMYLQDLYTVSANLAGFPALSIPVAAADDSDQLLPVGVQLIAPAQGERQLLHCARLLEMTLPPMTAPACSA